MIPSSPVPNAPVWYRLACEMRAEGASIERIAEELGEDAETVEIVVCDVEPLTHAERARIFMQGRDE